MDTKGSASGVKLFVSIIQVCRCAAIPVFSQVCAGRNRRSNSLALTRMCFLPNSVSVYVGLVVTGLQVSVYGTGFDFRADSFVPRTKACGFKFSAQVLMQGMSFKYLFLRHRIARGKARDGIQLRKRAEVLTVP